MVNENLIRGKIMFRGSHYGLLSRKRSGSSPKKMLESEYRAGRN